MAIVKTYYKVHRVFPDPDYFYLENTSGGNLAFNVIRRGTPASTDLSYSLDKETWTDIHNGGSVSDVPAGTKVYFRSSTGFSNGTSNYYTFNTPSGSSGFDAGGHIATLIDYQNWNTVTSVPNGSLCYILGSDRNTQPNRVVHANIDFYGIKSVLGNGCYSMFGYATSLVTVPDFSSITSLESGGFEYTFIGCTSLQTPADFSGITEVNEYAGFTYCYADCSLLADVIAPNVSTWTTSTFRYWLNNVASTGVVRKPAGLTIPTDNVSGVPTGWTTENY